MQKFNYKPVMQTGFTRPYERYYIFLTTPPCFDNSYGIDTGSDNKYIAIVRAQASKVTTESYARLLSSAPELLDALRACFDCMTYEANPGAYNKARALIERLEND